MQTMTVKLPDGTLVKNVPVGTPKEEILAKFNGEVAAKTNAPVEPEESHLLGFTKGFMKPFTNLSRLLETTNTEGGKKAYNSAFSSRYGYTPGKHGGVKETEAQFQGYLDKKEKEGVVPGKTFENIGELVATAPAMYLNPFMGGAVAAGLTTDERDAKGVATDMLIGGAFGKTADKVLGTLGDKARPVFDEGLERLSNMKVATTLGQHMGGLAKNVEDKLTSVPILGNAIDARRAEGLDHWREGVFNRVLEPIGKKLPANIDDLGHGAFTYTKQRLNEAYNRVLPKAKFEWDQKMIDDLANFSGKANEAIPRNKTRLTNIINQRILPKLGKNGKMTGHQYKDLDSYFAGELRRGKNASTIDDREYLDSISELKGIMKDTFFRSNAGTDVGKKLVDIDYAYARRSTLKKAIEKSNTDGSFTPQNLMSAVRQTSKGDDFARGNGLLQLEAIAGKRLASDSPDSGSIGRLLTGAGLLTAGGSESFAGGGDLPTGTAAALAIPTLLYTKQGQKVLKGMFGKSMTKHKLLEASRKPAGLLSAHLGPSLLPDY